MAKDILLWSGCVYRKNLVSERESIVSVFKAAGLDFETLDDEGCCYFPIFLAGYIEKAKERADELEKSLSGYEMIVTPCPACYRMFKHIYPEELGRNLGPEVLHTSQFFLNLIKEGKLSLRREVKMKIMYHDPCELGRHSGIYEEPRQILSRIPGLEIFRPRYEREKAVCCGGGGLLSAFSPSLAAKIAARKLQEEDRVPEDLDAIVTGCPQCISNLRAGIRFLKSKELREIKVMNIAQLIELSLGGD
ncbi:MAG: hypothetical protein DRO05_07095 [Thermoproteota archaeon]|nr:MAG: hypothetical protein DRO05_07095 [Candidatus Korarchaeota archaeon]